MFSKDNFSNTYQFFKNEIGSKYYFIAFPKFVVKEELMISINFEITNSWMVNIE